MLAAVGVEDWGRANQIVQEAPQEANRHGVLHLMSKRGHFHAVEWLLRHRADPNALWDHWDAMVTPLHLAALHGHSDVVTALLRTGADASIHDSLHDSDPRGWAEHAGRKEIVELLDLSAP